MTTTEITGYRFPLNEILCPRHRAMRDTEVRPEPLFGAVDCADCAEDKCHGLPSPLLHPHHPRSPPMIAHTLSLPITTPSPSRETLSLPPAPPSLAAREEAEGGT